MIDLPKVIGHRGACAYAPENTLTSMRKAAELGASWVEFDVQITACGECVVIHDDKLKRTTGAAGRVTQSTYSDLAQLDAGSWFAPEFSDEKIPTLENMLLTLQQLQLQANIELKPHPDDNMRLVSNTLAVINKIWDLSAKPLLFSSSSLEILQMLRQLQVELSIGVLFDVWREEWQSLIETIDPVSIHLNYRALNSDNIAILKKQGLMVLAYTVNDPQKAKQLFDWGVDSVFSDVPDIIIMECVNAS